MPSQASIPMLTWARAENPDYADDWQVWGALTGISDIAIDGDTIWIASTGLLALDQTHNTLTHYLFPTFPLPGNSLHSVLYQDGALYVSGDAGVSIWRGDDWITYSASEIGLDLDFNAPLALQEGTLWVAGKKKLARLNADGRWETFQPKALREKGTINRMVVEDGILYVIVGGMGEDARRDVYRFEDGELVKVDRPELAFFKATNGDLWKGERNALSYSKDGGQTWEEALSEGGAWFVPLAEDDQGRIYARARFPNQLYVFEENKLVGTYDLQRSDAPEINFINILQWDDAGRLWIATDGRGLTMFDGRRWRNWQPENSHLRDDAIRAMLVTRDKVYAGVRSGAASGGLSVFDIASETWTNYWPDESPLSYGGVGGLAEAKDGRIFMMTSDGALNILDGEQWSYASMPIPKNALPTYTDGFFDPTGVYWVATDAIPLGVWGYDGEKWTNFRLPVGIKSMVMDSQRRLWLGTDAGLLVRDINGKWLLYAPDALGIQGVSAGWIEDIAIDNAGRAWLMTLEDLVIFNGAELQHITPAERVGKPFWGEAIAFDQEGRAWLEASDLLVRFDGEPEIGPFAGLTLPPTQTFRDKDFLLFFPAE